jgi:hypothetical protein
VTSSMDSTEESTALWSLEDAPVDDEPLTRADEAALAEAESELAQGKIVSHGEARHFLLGKT